MPSMKVLFVSGDRAISDQSSQSARRMRAYASLCEELHVVVAGGEASYTDGRLVVHGTRARGMSMLVTLPKLIRSLIREKGIAVVSAQDPFEYGLIAHLATARTSAKLHLQIHTDFLSPEFVRVSPFLNSVRVRIADRLLPKAHGIRVVSHRIYTAVIARYGTRVVEPVVIPIQLAEPEALAVWKAPFPFTLVTIARLEKEKELMTLLRAMKDVREAYPQAGLVIVGDGRMRLELEQAANALGLKDTALFLGTRSDASAILEGATAYVQTSAYEGYGMALIEAARAGLPIISTDVGVVGDVLIPGRDVLVVSKRNSNELARAIIRLIEDTQLRDLLRLSAGGAVSAHLAANGKLEEKVMENLEAMCAPVT